MASKQYYMKFTNTIPYPCPLIVLVRSNEATLVGKKDLHIIADRSFFIYKVSICTPTACRSWKNAG